MNCHALLRINPKGETFIGRCIYCHKEGFALEDAKKECPNAPDQEQQILNILDILEKRKYE